MLQATDTTVAYPTGALASTGLVVHVEPLGNGRSGVVLDTTACHPVDAAWPDQPADRGVLTVAGVAFDIIDCVVGATDGSALYIGGDIPVRRGTDGWGFVAVHIIDGSVEVGARADVRVNADHRHALSAGHTACHLASLALNAQLASAWTKDGALDGLGNPNFDALAIETSAIGEYQSLDVYRIGKSLRKRGFTPAALDDLDAVAAGTNARLTEWLASKAGVTIVADGDGLTSPRAWRCELPGHPVAIPCGGTHLRRLGELRSVTVSLAVEQVESALELRMTTVAAARD